MRSGGARSRARAACTRGRGLRPAPLEIPDAARRLDTHYIPARYPSGFADGYPGQLYTRGQSEQAIADATVKILIRIAIVLAVVAGFLYLFMRSAQNVLSEPYVIARHHAEPWTLAVDAGTLPSSPLLVARPPQQFGRELFGQIFSRMRESLRGATDASVPVILRAEYALSLAGRYTPQELLDTARAAGLESAAFTPVCVAIRRISEPGLTREVYFVIVDAPAVWQFRRQIAAALEPQAAATFDPASLSLLLMIGGTDAGFERSMPTSATAEADCVAPIEIG